MTAHPERNNRLRIEPKIDKFERSPKTLHLVWTKIVQTANILNGTHRSLKTGKSSCNLHLQTLGYLNVHFNYGNLTIHLVSQQPLDGRRKSTLNRNTWMINLS